MVWWLKIGVSEHLDIIPRSSPCAVTSAVSGPASAKSVQSKLTVKAYFD